MKCFVYGHWGNVQPTSANEGLLYKLIEAASAEKIQFVSSLKEAELIILMPYLNRKVQRWALIQLYLRGRSHPRKLLKAIFGIKPNQKLLAVSYENLDHRSWYWFGKVIRQLDVPRLTFWPEQIDPKGCRFPYWWNFIDFDGFELAACAYERFGRPLELKKLMAPITGESNKREDAICVLTRHQRWPRNNEIAYLQSFKPVHVYQKGTPLEWSGSKWDLLSKYKYAFSAENSVGYGYQTEKLPEAWIAGCMPVGFSPNPYSDFNISANGFDLVEMEKYCFNQPLIKKAPNIDNVMRYLKERVFVDA